MVFDNAIKRLSESFSLLKFNVKVSIVSGKKWAIVDGKTEIEPSINSPIHSAGMIICSEYKTSVTFKFEVLFVAIVTGVLPDDQNCFDELICFMCSDSGYFMCQEIPHNMSTIMTFQTKSLHS